MVNLLVSGYPGDAEANLATPRNAAIISTTDCKGDAHLSPRGERKLGPAISVATAVR